MLDIKNSEQLWEICRQHISYKT